MSLSEHAPHVRYPVALPLNRGLTQEQRRASLKELRASLEAFDDQAEEFFDDLTGDRCIIADAAAASVSLGVPSARRARPRLPAAGNGRGAQKPLKSLDIAA